MYEVPVAHCIISDLINEKVTHYKPKTTLCRNLKTIDVELLTEMRYLLKSTIEPELWIYTISYHTPQLGESECEKTMFRTLP